MTSWKHLVAYKCKRCGEDCLNDHRQSRARDRECRDCHYIPDLDLAPDQSTLEDEKEPEHKAVGSLDFPEGSRTEPDGSRPRQEGPKGPNRPAVLWEEAGSHE